MKTMIKNWGMAVGMGILCMACVPNISSSELAEMEAKDLKFTATIYEENGKSTSTIYALLKTIPDDVGIHLNSGETLKATSETEVGVYSKLTFMSYNESIFNLGEQYVANVVKPQVGNNYNIVYTDARGTKTEALFASKGVPDLVTPESGTTVSKSSVVALTWQKQDLGKMYVVTYYDTIHGGVGSTSFATSDTGSYDLDLKHAYFNDMALGEVEVGLKHSTYYFSMEGFGDASINVESTSLTDIVVTDSGSSKKSLKKMVLDWTPEMVFESCAVACTEGVQKKIQFQDEVIDCCL